MTMPLYAPIKRFQAQLEIALEKLVRPPPLALSTSTSHYISISLSLCLSVCLSLSLSLCVSLSLSLYL